MEAERLDGKQLQPRDKGGKPHRTGLQPGVAGGWEKSVSQRPQEKIQNKRC